VDWRDSLTDYLRTRLPSADEVRLGRLSGMPAGASNETIGIDIHVRCDGQETILPMVLRPERSNGILAPYDIERQFRVMRALSRTSVPVPAVAWYEPDRAVIGAPFFFMTREQGETLPLFWYGGQGPRLRSVAAALAAVHAIDWKIAGLEFLLPPDWDGSAHGADLASWHARAAHARVHRAPLLVSLRDFLRRNEPSDRRLCLLHGDPNPGNYLMLGDEVSAVLDWEVAGIGDPRSDLGFYAALMTAFGGAAAEGGQTLLSRAYEDVVGRRLEDLEYYEGVGLYKMAIVMVGWTGRNGFGQGLNPIARRLSLLFGPRWAT
jgi:aminoglycoside phosphotransferase (APT) family kinase protein